jgi:biotin transport system substrate-specific component
MLAGEAVLLACGYAWLVALSGGAGWIDQSNVLLSAFEKAVAPFIVWDLLKLAFAGLTVSGLWTLLSRR